MVESIKKEQNQDYSQKQLYNLMKIIFFVETILELTP